MKKLLILCIATTLGVAAANYAVLAKAKDSKATKAESGAGFDMTGTITKHEIDVCMEGHIKYDLHPAAGDTALLSDGHRHDLMVLEEAARSHKPVRVEGTWVTGTECKYVKVEKATAVAAK